MSDPIDAMWERERPRLIREVMTWSAIERAAERIEFAVASSVLFPEIVETAPDNGFHRGNRSDGKHYWLTPPDLYAELDAEFHFDFDPCPYPLPDGFDGLTCEWGQSNYVNPPFGSIWHQGRLKGPTAWARKAIEEHRKGKTVVFVYPMHKWRLMLLAETGSSVRNLGDVRWLATEDGLAGPGTGEHIACFVLRAAALGRSGSGGGDQDVSQETLDLVAGAGERWVVGQDVCLASPVIACDHREDPRLTSAVGPDVVGPAPLDLVVRVGAARMIEGVRAGGSALESNARRVPQPAGHSETTPCRTGPHVAPRGPGKSLAALHAPSHVIHLLYISVSQASSGGRSGSGGGRG